jgi:excisionase family DNA binding protein
MKTADRGTNAPADYSPFTHKTISVTEAAEALGVTTRTIWRLCGQDRILFTRGANRRLRIYRESLFNVSHGTVQSETSGLSSAHTHTDGDQSRQTTVKA